MKNEALLGVWIHQQHLRNGIIARKKQEIVLHRAASSYQWHMSSMKQPCQQVKRRETV